MLYIFHSFLNLFSLVLWPNTWSILENVPCACEKKMYILQFGDEMFYKCLFSKLLSEHNEIRQRVSKGKMYNP